jgi:hypothetical protein
MEKKNKLNICKEMFEHNIHIQYSCPIAAVVSVLAFKLEKNEKLCFFVFAQGYKRIF